MWLGLLTFSLQFQSLAVTIYTPKGTSVYVFYNGPDFTQQEKNDLANWVHTHYPQAIILQEATPLYNCHSYAWNMSEGGPTYWMNTPEDDKYWTDGSYLEVSDAAKGEKVSYPYGDHSAIETSVDDVFDSKWGAYPMCRHARTHCPYDIPNYRTKYYARFERAVAAKTYASGSDAKVASYGAFTTGTNTNVASGATVRFASHGAMSIQSGLIVENGSIFQLETW
jgi:hypothetical protein